MSSNSIAAPAQWMFVGIFIAIGAECGKCETVSEPQQVARSAISRLERERQALKTPKVPPARHVSSMTAECYCHVLAPLVKDVPAFEVPPQHFGKILDYFRHAELDQRPFQEDGELGTIRIGFETGGTLRICWFWAGKKARMRFSFAGIRYITRGEKFADDETLTVDAFLRNLYAQIKEKQNKAAGPDKPRQPGGHKQDSDQHHKAIPDIPSPQSVTMMVAEAYSHMLAPIVKDVPQFEVPKELYAELLDHFRNAEHDPDAKEVRRELGSIRLSLDGGTSCRICWFWLGHKGRMYFSYAGARFVTKSTKYDEDETLEFDARIRLIHRDLEARKERGRGPIGIRTDPVFNKAIDLSKPGQFNFATWFPIGDAGGYWEFMNHRWSEPGDFKPGNCPTLEHNPTLGEPCGTITLFGVVPVTPFQMM